MRNPFWFLKKSHWRIFEEPGDEGGGRFCENPLLPHQEIQYETIFLFRIYDFFVKAVWIEINNFINCILDGPILVLVA